MQAKTTLIAVLALLCAGVVGWVLWDATGPNNLAEWSQDDEVALSEAELADELASFEDDTDGTRAEFEGADQTFRADDTGDTVRPLVAIRGRIVDKLVAPVAGATVSLSASSRSRRNRNRNRISLAIVTGRDGTFAFSGKGFRRMRVTLEVTHADYAIASTSKPFDDAKGVLDMGDIRIVVGGTIVGSVTDMQGNLVPNAQAQLSPADRGGNRGWSRGRWGRRSTYPAVSADANGVFRLEHVAPGRHRVTASAPRRQRASEGPITITDAQEVRLDPIHLGPGFLLTGVVYRPDGKPLPDAAVDIHGNRNREYSQKTGKAGEFSFDHLPAGEYDIEVEADGYLRNKAHNAVSVTRSGPVIITMKPGLRIHGVVVDATTGQPVLSYGARVQRLANLPDPDAARAQAEKQHRLDEFRRLRKLGNKRTPAQTKAMEKVLGQLHEPASGRDRGERGRRSRDGGRSRRGGRDRGNRGRRGRSGWSRRNDSNLPGFTGKVRTHPEGRFSFNGLEEGIYVVDIGSPKHQKIRSARVELREATELPALTLVATRGLVVAGTVVSRRHLGPLHNAEIELRLVLEDNRNAPPNPRPSSQNGNAGGRHGGFDVFRRSSANGLRTTGVLSTRTAKDGSFALENAPSGRYILRAEASDHTTVSTEPFVLEADRPSFQLALGALGVIEGRVTGVPIGRATEVSVIAYQAPWTTRDAKVTKNGTYRITGLEPGDYIVRAFLGANGRRSMFRQMFRALSRNQGDANQSQQIDVQVKEGGRHRFNTALTVDLTGTVVGRVLINGQGAMGYRVSLRKIEDGSSDDGEDWRRRFRRGNNATVDQNGNYELEGVDVGEYSVTIAAASGGRGGRGGDKLSRTRIFVAAEQTVTVPLVSIDFGGLLGTITVPAATPEKSTSSPAERGGNRGRRGSGRISLYKDVTTVPDPSAPGGTEVLRFSTRIKDSKFEFKELPAGSYLLQLRLPGRESVTKTIYVGAGTKATLDLVAGAQRSRDPNATPSQPGARAGQLGGPPRNRGGAGNNGRRGRR